MTQKILIDTSNLSTIAVCLEQLVNAERAQLSIELQIAQPSSSNVWRKRAETALRAVKAKRRLITARLAVLRQEEKERNMHNHDQYLIAELREIVTPSSFERCARLATEKMENTASQNEF
ncbi:hypothetical protein [Phytobacter sp. RSE-02]|uniref:hypothetical protein n=1 Tax=Phytobacter sp. RSE-02 TaxID=3229229 RepID=UPI00339D5870